MYPQQAPFTKRRRKKRKRRELKSDENWTNFLIKVNPELDTNPNADPVPNIQISKYPNPNLNKHWTDDGIFDEFSPKMGKWEFSIIFHQPVSTMSFCLSVNDVRSQINC